MWLQYSIVLLVKILNHIIWVNPNYEWSTIKEDFWSCSIDLSEGIGKDSIVCNFFKWGWDGESVTFEETFKIKTNRIKIPDVANTFYWLNLSGF